MIRTKNNSELSGAFHTTIDAFLIEVGSEQIHTIRTAYIIRPVSVQVPESRTVSGVDNRSDLKMLLNILLVLEWNAMSIHKGEVRDSCLKLLAHCDRFWKALAEEPGQPLESLSTLVFNLDGRGVAGEKRALRMCVCRNPASQPARKPRM